MEVEAFNPSEPPRESLRGFAEEGQGVVSIGIPYAVVGAYGVFRSNDVVPQVFSRTAER